MRYKYFIVIISSLLLLQGCSKFLDEKSDFRLTTPETLEDNQALLDRVTDILTNNASSGEVSSDDYYLTDSDFQTLPYDEDKRLYTWQPSHVSTNESVGNDWASCYRTIYIANAVLYNIEKYQIANADNIKGQALTIRAARYLDAAQVWCPVYNKSSAAQDLGLPLRLDPDMKVPSIRSNVQQTYDQIISDLKMAVPILPDRQIAATRPSKATALGLLARTYLFMGEYDSALQNAIRALEINNSLIDFNTLNAAASIPIQNLNVEVILRATMRLARPINSSLARISPGLYNLYDNNDLRKTMLFRTIANGDVFFRGSYTGSSTGKIVGITTGELYLIAAECYVRTNQIEKAMDKMNELLVNRFTNGTFVPLSITDQHAALDTILKERRKELLFRGLRWADLKRLNRDGANILLSRTVNGQSYTLAPNDLRYAIAIPEEVIALSGIQQNKR